MNKYFSFVIKGNKLNPHALNDKISLSNGEVYIKGETTLTRVLKREVVTKETKWVLNAEEHGNTSIQKFLTKNLELVISKLDVLKPYIASYTSEIELVIYSDYDEDVENRLLIKISKENARLLSEIGVDLQIAHFFD